MKKQSVPHNKMPSAEALQAAEMKRNGQTRKSGGYADQTRGTSSRKAATMKRRDA